MDPDRNDERGEREAESASAEVGLRGSREATLGTQGLRVERAEGTVPSAAPDDRRVSPYANSASGDASDDEPRASREASLGESTASPSGTAAGGLAPEDRALPYGSRPGDPDPERDWTRDVRNPSSE